MVSVGLKTWVACGRLQRTAPDRTFGCLSFTSEVTSRMLDMSQMISLLSRPTEANFFVAGE